MNKVMFFKKIARYGAKLGLGKSQKMNNLYEDTLSKISSYSRLEQIEINEHKIFLDKEDSLMLSIRKDSYDKLEFHYLEQIIKKGDTVIDVGANIGYYTLNFAKLVGESGHVFAFEPDPSNFELLSKNIEENNYNNVTLIQKAVSNENSKIKLYISKRNLASHRIFNAEDKRSSIDVDVITLDQYFKKIEKPIKLIKMDVEGAEGASLLGSKKIIENSDELVIMMEYFPKWIKKFGYVPEDVLRSLIEKQFRLFNINQDAKKLETIDLTKFINRYNEEKKNYTNILCVKGKPLELSNI